MPLADYRDIGRGEQAYEQSPSGPGPYAPQMQRQVPDLQPYTEAMGWVPPRRYGATLLNSPSGPRGAAFQAPGPAPAWLERVRRLLGNATTGLDPARQQPRTTQTTDPDAGYGQSPSGPTAQQPTRQPQPQRPAQDLKPYTGADQIGQQIAGYGMPPRNVDYGVGAASAPWAVGPSRGPKPMSPAFEGPQPSMADRIGYFGSPSGPGWRPPGG